MRILRRAVDRTTRLRHLTAPTPHDSTRPRRYLPRTTLSSTDATSVRISEPHSPNTSRAPFPRSPTATSGCCCPACCVSGTGGWVQRIAQDWLVLTMTDSPTAVGRHDRVPVPPDPAVRAARRPARRPLPQAPAPPRHPGHDDADGRGPRRADPHRPGRGLARLPARRRPRRRRGGRQPGAPVVRHRGRRRPAAAQRDQHGLLHLPDRRDGRPGPRRPPDEHGRRRLGLRRQRASPSRRPSPRCCACAARPPVAGARGPRRPPRAWLDVAGTPGRPGRAVVCRCARRASCGPSSWSAPSASSRSACR